MSALRELIARLRESIEETDPAALSHELDAATSGEPPLLIDVREPDEWETGHLPGAVSVPRGLLELRIGALAPDPSRRVVLYCAGGTRSLLAADSLRRLGHGDVASLAGGVEAWKDSGRALVTPRSISAEQRRRYARHLSIPEIGEAGQARLLDARVLLVGAGGLGSPAALYLAAAGVGRLRIVDDDVVDETNLQRQVLHDTRAVGRAKTESARDRLVALNPDVVVEAVQERLDSSNVDRIVEGCDVVLDGCDNFPTRYLVNDACVKHALPNVHGSVYRFEGQVTVFWPGRGPCYRCLFPEPPPPELAPSCAEAGVLGVMPGLIGTIEASEVLKILLGVGEPLVGRLLHHDALAATFHELRVRRDERCAVCADGVAFPGYVDYAAFCASS